MRKTQGFSLVELLIGLLLGAFLIAGMVEILGSFSKSYKLRDSISRIQEDGRFAIEIMSRELRRTGYRAYPRTGTIAQLFRQNSNAFEAVDNFDWGARVMGVDGLPDSFMIRFQVENEEDLTDSLCRPEPTLVTIALTAAGLDYSDDNANVILSEKFYLSGHVLKCDSRVDYNDAAGVAQAAILGNAQPIVSNIETMRILYGLDTDPIPATADGATPPTPCDSPFYTQNVSYELSDDNHIPNKYVDAATVNATVLLDDPNGRTIQDRDIAGNCVTRSPWSAVKSIRFSLIMRSEDIVADKETSSITINGGNIIPISSSDQKRLFQNFSTTVMLRNIAFTQ